MRYDIWKHQAGLGTQAAAPWCDTCSLEPFTCFCQYLWSYIWALHLSSCHLTKTMSPISSCLTWRSHPETREGHTRLGRRCCWAAGWSRTKTSVTHTHRGEGPVLLVISSCYNNRLGGLSERTTMVLVAARLSSWCQHGWVAPFLAPSSCVLAQQLGREQALWELLL